VGIEQWREDRVKSRRAATEGGEGRGGRGRFPVMDPRRDGEV
jgi:hypothetical protein